MDDSCELKKIQKLFEVSQQANGNRRELIRFILEERYPKVRVQDTTKEKNVSKLSPILEYEESGECFPFTDEDTCPKEFSFFDHEHCFSNMTFESQAPDEASERLHGLHLGLHHKYNLYEESSVENGALTA
ncbi:unnamed protein product [Linum trigynum]|uniref:SAP domain-containing protein n=1 Tax=Linum trigynum TaxID=586398 RepID=A0AAV2CKD4_9ROSI